METGYEMQIILSVIGSSICMFLVLLSVLHRRNVKQLILKSYEDMCIGVQNMKAGFWDYEKWNKYLLMNGAEVHFGEWINPITYLILCILLGIIGFVIGITQSILFSVVGGTLGILLPGFLIDYMNKKDNEEMLTDLNLVYNALAIQIRAGVYVADALMECYSSVKHRRLKSGLLRLSGDLVINSDMDKALENFQSRFNNKYIDALCITIAQALESGQAIELLGDIGEQIKDMELLAQNRKKQKLDRSITFYELGIFAALIGLVVYACVENMFQSDMFLGGGLF